MVQTRRQSGIIATKALPILDSDPEEPEDERDEAFEPPKKRARTSKGQRNASKNVGGRKRAGKLAMLPNMPLDVLFEIFGHLHPQDLLHLARTTKSLRKTLMHRSALSVWKTARTNLPGFPDCPPDLCEPEYASLAFDHHCEFCDKGARNTDWYTRARVCRRCKDDRECFVFWFNAEAAFPGQEELIRDIGGLGFDESSAPYWFYKPRMARLVNKMDILKADEAGLARFREEVTSHAAQIEEHARACYEWEDSLQAERYQAKQDARSQRLKAIREKLLELGYSEDLFQFADLRGHNLVDKPQKLTERIWNNIKEPLIIWLDIQKTEKAQYDRRSLIVRRQLAFRGFWNPFEGAHRLHMVDSNNDAETYFPTYYTALKFPLFSNHIEAPSETVVNRETFEAISREEIDQCIEEWRSALAAKLAAVIPGCQEDNALSVACRAACVVRCDSCYSTSKRGLWFPEAVQHYCFATGGSGYAQVEDMNLVYDKERSAFAKEVVKRCGLDPAMAKSYEMKDMSPVLACSICVDDVATSWDLTWVSMDYQKERGATGLTWEECVNHKFDYHLKKRVTWTLLSTRETREEEDSFDSGSEDDMTEDDLCVIV